MEKTRSEQLNKCKNDQRSKEGLEDNRKPEDLEIITDRVKDYGRISLVGTYNTFLGLKDRHSFLIGTFLKGMILVENGREIFSGRLPTYESIRDIIYIPALDCYFLDHGDKLYRKDINDKPAYIFMDLKFGYILGSSFRYSQIYHRLLIAKDYKKISIVNPETKKIEIVMKKSVEGDISDFRLFGEQENRVISVTRAGCLTLYSLTNMKKRGEVSHRQIELVYDRNEQPRSLAVCDKGCYVLVEAGNWIRNLSSRMIVFEIRGDTLIRKMSIEQIRDPLGQQYALESCGYVGRHALWVGLSKSERGRIMVYDFDTKTGYLREVKQKRERSEEDSSFKLLRLNDNFYFTGKNGRVMSLAVKI